MSTSLTYFSLTAVPADVLRLMNVAANSLIHSWWAEGITFFDDPTGTGRACGDTRLFLMSYVTESGEEREVSPESDSAMAWRDASFIVDQLEQWSKQHSIQWQLECAGAPVGNILDGIRDSSVSQFLASIKEVAEFEGEVTPERLATIDSEFADRGQ